MFDPEKNKFFVSKDVLGEDKFSYQSINHSEFEDEKDEELFW